MKAVQSKIELNIIIMMTTTLLLDIIILERKVGGYYNKVGRIDEY